MITKIITREHKELIEENKRLKETIEKQKETINQLVDKYITNEEEKIIVFKHMF